MGAKAKTTMKSYKSSKSGLFLCLCECWQSQACTSPDGAVSSTLTSSLFSYGKRVSQERAL